MTKDQNDQLVRIANALGFTVTAISPAFYAGDWGRLDLVDPATRDEFPWNPITNAGDRYNLIKKLRMVVDFSGERGNVKLPISKDITWSLGFPPDDEEAESKAIMRVADDWARSVLHAATAG